MTHKQYFINFTNHPSAFWDEYQKQEALRYGDEITDIPFPDIPAMATETEITRLAKEYAKKLAEASPAVVLCQGEFTFTYRLINHLKANKIKAVAACSERRTVETVEDGKTIKKTEYEFKGFREY